MHKVRPEARPIGVGACVPKQLALAASVQNAFRAIFLCLYYFFFFHALLGSPLGIALRFAIHVTAKLCAGSPAETDSAYGRRNIIDR